LLDSFALFSIDGTVNYPDVEVFFAILESEVINGRLDASCIGDISIDTLILIGESLSIVWSIDSIAVISLVSYNSKS
jgi:hypothetical protein